MVEDTVLAKQSEVNWGARVLCKHHIAHGVPVCHRRCYNRASPQQQVCQPVCKLAELFAESYWSYSVWCLVCLAWPKVVRTQLNSTKDWRQPTTCMPWMGSIENKLNAVFKIVSHTSDSWLQRQLPRLAKVTMKATLKSCWQEQPHYTQVHATSVIALQWS